MPISDIKTFIDFFTDACERIRKQKPVIVRGKDGRLIRIALQKCSEEELEQLALWFLAKKKTLSPTIGAMLSESVLSTLQKNMRQSGFWAEIAAITDAYYPRRRYETSVGTHAKPDFSAKEVNELKKMIRAVAKKFYVVHHHTSE